MLREIVVVGISYLDIEDIPCMESSQWSPAVASQNSASKSSQTLDASVFT